MWWRKGFMTKEGKAVNYINRLLGDISTKCTLGLWIWKVETFFKCGLFYPPSEVSWKRITTLDNLTCREVEMHWYHFVAEWVEYESSHFSTHWYWVFDKAIAHYWFFFFFPPQMFCNLKNIAQFSRTWRDCHKLYCSANTNLTSYTYINNWYRCHRIDTYFTSVSRVFHPGIGTISDTGFDIGTSL